MMSLSSVKLENCIRRTNYIITCQADAFKMFSYGIIELECNFRYHIDTLLKCEYNTNLKLYNCDTLCSSSLIMKKAIKI